MVSLLINKILLGENFIMAATVFPVNFIFH
jgi:hypothetical protein